MGTGSRDLIREMNRSLILNLVRSHGPISRTDVARLASLSPATVSEITALLLDQDLIREVGSGESTGGRRPILLTLNAGAGYVVGCKLMEHAVTTALTDLEASVLYSSLRPIETVRGVRHTLQAIADAVEETIRGVDIPRSKVLGVGIGMAGVVDHRAGICRYSPILGWRDVVVASPIEEILGLPVYIENDVNTLTIAEQWFGAGHGVNDFLVVTVGRGIGLGIVVNGQFYRGASGGAGEFGHTTIQENGPRCDCGKSGCLEAIAADPAVVRQVRAAIAAGRPSILAQRDPVTFTDVVDAAQAGDSIAHEALQRSGWALGIGLANLVNVFNPRLIIIAGEGVRAGDARFGPMYQALAAHTFDGLGEQLDVVIDQWGDEAWARGAASVVLGELFRPPVHRRDSGKAPSSTSTVGSNRMDRLSSGRR